MRSKYDLNEDHVLRDRGDYPDGMTLEQMSEAMQTHLDEVEMIPIRRAERAEAERDALRGRVEALEAGMRLKLQYPQAGCPGIVSMCPEENPEPGCVLVRDLAECWVNAALRGVEAK